MRLAYQVLDVFTEERFGGNPLAVVLDADQARRRAGVDADARAHLVLRPYVATAVEITLDDPADPVPYWLVSTRRPDALAAAVGRLVDTRLAE